MLNKAYPKYKPSGVEWLGDVPEHWGVKKLKFIGNALIGLTYSPDEVVDEDYIGKKHLVLRSTNIQDGKISLHENVYVTTPVQKELEVKKWDILICARNGSRHLVGKNALVTEAGENMTFGAFTTIFRSKINPFLFYFFASSQFQYQSTGFLTTTINQLTNGNLNSILVTLPPLPEQQAIAAFLDRETGKIDALIAKKQRLLELLAEQRTALISRAVTKGLSEIVSRGDAEFAEWGKKTVKMKPSGVEWLGDVPEHWGNSALKWASIRYSGGTPDKSIQEYWEDGTIPWLNSGAVNDDYITEPSEYITKEAFQNSSAKWIPKDALVMALAGQGKTKGMVGQLGFRTTCNQSMAAIIPNEKLNPRMLYWWLTKNYVNIRNLAGGEARDGLNLDLLGSIYVPLPPLPEQQAIAAFLDRETAKIDALSAKVSTVIERLKEYRKALISSAVTGKIDVRGTL